MKIKKLRSILEVENLKEQARLEGRQYFELNVSDLDIQDIQIKEEGATPKIRSILLNPDSIIVFYGQNKAYDDVATEFFKIIDVASEQSDVYEVLNYA